jgi:Ca-activated chloride channel family protein
MMWFADWWFLLFIPLAVFLFWFLHKRRSLSFSSVKLLRAASKGKTIKHKIGKTLVLCGVILAIIALARPQTLDRTNLLLHQGIDIAMILDISGSMQSIDFEPNRLEVARQTIDDFVAERYGDRLSFIVFAGEAFTRIPLTLDNNAVRESLAEVSTESVSRDGTAIGMAISVGLNRLKKSDAPSRIMILVTDGDNNAGAIDPVTAAGLAGELDIKIYTIGVGSDETILPYEAFGETLYQQVDGGLNEDLLKQIADMTGGQYFRAADEDALSRIFDDINRLETTEFDDNTYMEYNELAFPFIMAALLLLAIGIFLDRFYFVQVP